jgi:hypothetical protein
LSCTSLWWICTTQRCIRGAKSRVAGRPKSPGGGRRYGLAARAGGWSCSAAARSGSSRPWRLSVQQRAHTIGVGTRSLAHASVRLAGVPGDARRRAHLRVAPRRSSYRRHRPLALPLFFVGHDGVFRRGLRSGRRVRCGRRRLSDHKKSGHQCGMQDDAQKDQSVISRFKPLPLYREAVNRSGPPRHPPSAETPTVAPAPPRAT